MNRIFIIIALLGLSLSALSPLLTFFDVISVSLNKTLLFAGMLLWFAGAIPWLGREPLKITDTKVEI